MGLHFNKITLHNFGSYNHAEIDLQNRGFCLVSGENNYEKDNASSNGAGKSLIWSGICFALTGTTIQGLHSNLQNINVDENLCYTILDFSYEKDNYVITRYIAPKSDLKIIKNGIDVSGKGIKESSKKLEEYLPDITYELIASTIILGQGLPQKFSAFSPSGRKELLEKLTKSDFMIEDVKNRVASRFDAIASNIRSLEDKVLIDNTRVETLTKTKENLTNDLANAQNTNYNDTIDALTKELATINTQLDEKEAELSKAEPTINKLNIELNSKVTEKNTVVEDEFKKYKEAIGDQYQVKATTASSIKTKETELQKLKSITDICPTCGQKLQNVQKPDTTKQEVELKQLRESLSVVEDKIKNIEATHQKYTASIDAAFKDDLQRINKELSEANTAISEIKRQINDITTKKNQININLNSTIRERDMLNKTIKTISDNLADTEAEISRLQKELAGIATDNLELQEHLAVIRKIDTLIKRDFRGYLLSNIIEYLDTRAKQYCKIVFDTTDLSIYLDGNNLDVTYCNKLLDNLSGGERTRVDLILQLSIRDLLCKYFGYTSNILVLDEVTDFLDAKSCDAVMQLISTQLQDVESVFIISHHAESLALPIDSELKILKNTNGISEVVKV